jgi:hypothetical protein
MRRYESTDEQWELSEDAVKRREPHPWRAQAEPGNEDTSWPC